MYGSIQDKKLANVLFNITYKKSESYCTNSNFNHLDSINSENHTNINFSLINLSKIERFSNFHEESVLPFIYYGIKNQTILLNGSSENLDDSLKFQKTNFFSIHDIQELEISGELKSEKIPIDRLIELLSISKKRFEFYEVLKKINSFFNKQEISLEKIVLIMQKITLRLEEIQSKVELHDEVLVPYIYFVLKNLLLKSKKILDNNCGIYFNTQSYEKNCNMNEKTFNDKNDFIENIKIDSNKINCNLSCNNAINNHIKNNSNNNLNNSTFVNEKDYNINENIVYKSQENKNYVFFNFLKNRIFKNNFKNSAFDNNNNNLNDSENNINYNSKDNDHKDYFRSNSKKQSKNNIDLILLKEIILKEFLLAIGVLELQTYENSVVNSKKKKIFIINKAINKTSFINDDTYFGWNRNKINASIFFLSILFEDFVLLSVDKSKLCLILKIIFKEFEAPKNNPKFKNNHSIESNSKFKENSVKYEIDQNRISTFLFNLNSLLNNVSKCYDNADLVMNILSIQIKIMKTKELGTLEDVNFKNVLTDEVFFKISKNFRSNSKILINLYHLTAIYIRFIKSNYPEFSMVL